MVRIGSVLFRFLGEEIEGFFWFRVECGFRFFWKRWVKGECCSFDTVGFMCSIRCWALGKVSFWSFK